MAAEPLIRGSAPTKYNGTNTYASAKLFTAWWSAALARRLPAGMTVNTVSPGRALNTKDLRNQGFFMRRVMTPLVKKMLARMGLTAECGSLWSMSVRPIPAKHVDQPQTLDEKHDHATILRDHHGFEFTVANDDIDGSLHRAMSPKPNSAYVLDTEGTILFRAHWANDTNGLRQAITTVTSGQPLVKTRSRALMGPMLRVIGYIDPILETAGPRSRRDMWKAAPPMAMLSKLTGLFPFLRRDRRGAAAVALSMTTLAATIALVALLA